MARWSSSRFLLLLAILFDATSCQISQSRVDFDAEPTDFYPTIGQNVSLRCEIASAKTITWISNAVAVKSTESPLFVRKFDESYEGDYFCVANFENGERIRSKSAKLRTRVILEGPKIAARSDSYHPSETITAWTIASGLSNQFRVEWILRCRSFQCRVAMDDGCRDVATHQSQLNSSATYATLRIRRNESNFLINKCESLEVHIRARVDPSSAFVASTPSFHYRVPNPGALNPVLQLAPIDTSVELGQSATLYCVANEADGVYEYAWDRDGVRLPLSGVEAKWSLVQDGILRIDNVSRADAGVYRCNVSGRHEWTHSARLSVYEKPRVEVRVNVVSRALLSVSCRLLRGGAVPGSVSILFNGATQKVVSTTTDEEVEAELLLTTSGIVQCLVENRYGSSQDALNVTMETVVPDNDPSPSSQTNSTPMTSLDVLAEKTTFPPTLRIGEVENSSNKMTPIVVGSIVSVAVLIIVIVIIILLLNRRKQSKETQIVVKVNPFAGEKNKDGANNQTGTGGSRSNDYGSFQRVAIDDPDADDLPYAKIEMMPLPRENDVDDGASEASSAYAVVGNVYPAATKAKKSPPIPKPYRSKPPIPSPYTPKGEKTKNCGLKLEHYVVGDDAYAMLQKSPSQADDSDKVIINNYIGFYF
ncbi:uncharacterized protein [Oscarella lobularis]|uniref:uncharacterized protein n=1 Tax=Oscarella lobularis TaxID=121494 RepID=UPI0033132E29